MRIVARGKKRPALSASVLSVHFRRWTQPIDLTHSARSVSSGRSLWQGLGQSMTVPIGADMAATDRDPLKNLLIHAMTDAFNRSISALEEAGAFSLKKMRSEYKGVGSRYYDVVTEAMLQTIAQHQPTFEQFFSRQSKSASSDSTP